MKMSKYLVAIAITLGTAMAVQAAGVRGGAASGRGGAPSGPAAMQRAAVEAVEVTALRPAFTLLLGADHDYQGNRVKAMVAIAEACRLMGTDIVPPGLREKLENAGSGTKPPGAGTTARPAGRGTAEKSATTVPESQTLSDQQLRRAQSIVQQVRSGIPTGKQPRISELLDKAVTELATALSIK